MDQENKLDLSVIICTYTEARWDYLATVVQSVLAQNTLPREIVVVVDHNAALLERVRAEFPGLIVVENTAERGLSGARNSGIAAASSSVIAFIDDDAIAAPDWAEKLYAPYSDPKVMGVGGTVTPVWLVGKRPRWFPEEFEWVVGCSYVGLPTRTEPVRNFIGCNMSYRREVFDAVGNFESALGPIGGSLHICCEETELCIRFNQRWPDRDLLYDPQVGVQHQVPASRGEFRYFVSRCYAEGLAKALVSRFVGSMDSLANERAYTMRVLPKGVLRGLADVITHGDLTGLLRAGAIVAGLGITAWGYVVGNMRGIRTQQDVINEKRVSPI